MESNVIQLIIAEDKNGDHAVFMAPLGTTRVDEVIADVEGEQYVVKAVELMGVDSNEFCFFRQMIHYFDVDGIYNVDAVVEFREVGKAICGNTEE